MKKTKKDAVTENAARAPQDNLEEQDSSKTTETCGTADNPVADKDDSQSPSESTQKTEALESEIASLSSQLKAAQDALAQSKETALRQLAEQENFKKRKQQELDTFKKYAAEKTILAFLPILDNFSLAFSQQQQEGLSEKEKQITDGFQLIHNQLISILEKLDVKEIDALHTPLDPAFHQAISQRDDDKHPTDTVVEVVQKGYTLLDRVIRPSMVITAS